MPWGRVDDHHYRHEKLGELDDDLRKGCIALYWLAISWCNDRLTDGRVPVGTVRILGGELAEAEELVRVNLWEKDGNGYRVHDFLDFNQSKEQVIRMREQRALAGAAGAAARWHPANDLPSTVPSDLPSGVLDEMHGKQDAPVTRLPLPVSPSPAPTSRDGLPHLTPEVVEAVETLTGRTIGVAGPRQLTELDRLVEDHGPAKVIDAMRKLAGGTKTTARQLVWGTMKALEPIPSGKEVAKQERTVELEDAAKRRLDSTQRYLRELRGESA